MLKPGVAAVRAATGAIQAITRELGHILWEPAETSATLGPDADPLGRATRARGMFLSAAGTIA